MVDHAETAKGVTVARHERDAGVRDDAELLDRRVQPHQRIRAGVLDDEGLAGGDDVLAERVRDGGLAAGGKRLGQADATLEELPVLVDERHQTDRRAQDAARDAGEPIE